MKQNKLLEKMLASMRRPQNVCYGKEMHLPPELQEILLDPLYGVKEFIGKHEAQFGDEAVLQDLQYTLNKATSLREHLTMFADFYRRQRIVQTMTQNPVNPPEDVSEAEFIQFWMSKLDYR